MSLAGIIAIDYFKGDDVSAIETLRDALFGNPPQSNMEPSREGVLAAFSELVQLVGSAAIADDIFESTSAGIAATANGDLFLVASDGDPSFADLYKNVSGSAVDQGISLPSTAFVEAQADLLAQTTADASKALIDASPTAPRAVSAIYLETIPATIKRITAQSYYPTGESGVSTRDRGGSDLVEVSAGPATVFRTQDAGGRWWEVVRSPIMRLTQLGAKGGDTFGTAPDETALINTIISDFASIGQTIYLDRVYRVSSYTAFKNLKGCRFIGPGDIIFPVAADPAGPSQYSGYASAIFDDDDRLESSGEEYLVAARNRLHANSALRTVAFGDSRYAWTTGADYNGVLFDENNTLQFILPQIGLDLGLPGAITVNNLAVPGTTFEEAWGGNTADGTPYGSATNGTTPFAAAESGNYDWMLLAFGINEFKDIADDTNRPGTIETRIASTLALWDGYFNYIRNTAGIGVEDLAITFLGPTSANHIRYQTTDAIKRLIVGLRRICRLYQVHYVDLYSRWSDSIRMAHITLDGAYYPSDWPEVADRGDPSSGPLHNLDVQQAALWGMWRDHMRRWFVTADVTNAVHCPPLLVETKTFAALPSTYRAALSQHKVLASAGWPADGLIKTERFADGDVWQTFRATGSVTAQTRVKNAGADTWSAWA